MRIRKSLAPFKKYGRITALLAMPVLLLSAAPTSAAAQDQAVAARDIRTGYQFDIPVPAEFIAALKPTGKEVAGYKTEKMTVAIKDRPQEIIVTDIGWDSDDRLDKGGFALANGQAVDGSWWRSVKPGAGWATFVQQLKAMATRNAQGWGFASVRYLVPTAGNSDALFVAHSKAAVARQQIVDLSKSTRPGMYFGTAAAPADLAAVQDAMLRYGNIERHRPNFRKDAGAKIALDLSGGRITNLNGTSEPVFAQPDLKLNADYNKAAQWFAEALAAGKANAHDGPKEWKDPKGTVVNMATPRDRTTYFGVPSDAMIAEVMGSSSEPGLFPHAWMAGDTHYRWWFGVDGVYPEIGFGAAKAANGTWYYVGVSRMFKDGRIPPELAVK